MRVVYLIGGIASGKSSVARLVERHGAARIDLDQLSRAVLTPGSPLLSEVVREFGSDLIGLEGDLNRGLLAQRVFAKPELIQRLEALELPAIKRLFLVRLGEIRDMPTPPVCVVVEVPLPERMGSLLAVADEIISVSCPLELRRARAYKRGVDTVDFDRRVRRQLTDVVMSALSDMTFYNVGDAKSLAAQVESWWYERFAFEL